MSTRSPRRTLACALVVVAATALAGCGGSTSTHAAPQRPSAASSSPADPVRTLWAEFTQVADRPAVPLRAPAGLKPVAGFTQADVDALAARALDILRRSTAPRLSRMDADAAVDYVYQHQYPATIDDFKSGAAGFTRGYDWQWEAASRYPSTPSAAKVIKVTGVVSSTRHKLDDGTPSRFMTVDLQAHIVQTVQSTSYGRVPIVVRRSVAVASYRPRGGPEWWPSVTARVAAFGNQGCRLYKGAELVPITDEEELRTDLAHLKISLASTRVLPEAFYGQEDVKSLRRYLAKACA